jgi:citronellol/citronellal dehydrogenase
VEWSRYGIKVNAVAPGYIQSSVRNSSTSSASNFFFFFKSQGLKNYPEEFVRRTKISVPLDRLGTTEEVAHLITFLASEKAASYITGQTYYIDGGSSLWGDSFELPSKL